MREFSTRHIVRHTADDMFNLVADVEKYPQFLPLCHDLRVRRRSVEEDAEVLFADMTVAYKLIKERFSSRVTLARPRRTILVEYVDGPFSHLENRWVFRPVAERACEVGFYIGYEFRSRTLGLLMGTVFDAAFRRFSAAFEQRADEVYGCAA
ncbi:MAG TPA: SRPBCC family protein [Xanthobacteraceae bacterium]